MSIRIKIREVNRQLVKQPEYALSGRFCLDEETSAFSNGGSLKTDEVDFADKFILLAEYASANATSLILETVPVGYAMFFVLDGKLEVLSGKAGLSLSENEYIIYNNRFLLLSSQLERPVRFLVVVFDQKIYSRLIEIGQAETLKPRKITPTGASILSSIVACKHSGYSKRIFYEAKALELLVLFTSLNRQQEQISFVSIKPYDLAKIYSAKEFIEKNIQSPCSLIELAHKVGLNDFKLKKGFKEVIGTTVFGYLYDYRMERAKILLENGSPVNEVSFQVGYKNPHHFTAAFKKKFGILPSLLKKQNRHNDE